MKKKLDIVDSTLSTEYRKEHNAIEESFYLLMK